MVTVGCSSNRLADHRSQKLFCRRHSGLYSSPDLLLAAFLCPRTEDRHGKKKACRIVSFTPPSRLHTCAHVCRCLRACVRVRACLCVCVCARERREGERDRERDCQRERGRGGEREGEGKGEEEREREGERETERGRKRGSKRVRKRGRGERER